MEVEEEILAGCRFRVADPEAELAQTPGRGRYVISSRRIRVQYSYPLTGRFEFDHDSGDDRGFTLERLILSICDRYRQIYREEDAQDPGSLIPGTYNRCETQGPYGIWGHVIGNLAIEGVALFTSGVYGLYVIS